jgi:hypothetical protein
MHDAENTAAGPETDENILANTVSDEEIEAAAGSPRITFTDYTYTPAGWPDCGCGQIPGEVHPG